MTLNVKTIEIFLDAIQQGTSGYVANWAALLHGLNVNTVRCASGGYGDTWKINMLVNPTTWAQNLENLLEILDANGFKMYFMSLGDTWGGTLGINNGAHGGTAVDINTAKVMIDQLAGNNSLGHNFITDPRILAWPIGNEDIIGTKNADGSITLNAYGQWDIALSDYIRSKGGLVIAVCPILDATAYNGNSWWESFSDTAPIFKGHVNYMDFHDYFNNDLLHTATQTGDYTAWLNALVAELQSYVTAANQNGFDINHVILGEWGLWHGYATLEGGPWTYTDQNNRDYINNYFTAIYSVGITWTSYHAGFTFISQPTGLYGLITPNGDGTATVLAGYNEVGANYIKNAIPLPWSDNFKNLNAWTIIDGTWTLITGGVQGSSTTEALMYAGNLAWTDYAATINTIITTGDQALILLRFTDANNWYWLGLGAYDTYEYSIGKCVNGVLTILASAGAASSIQTGVPYKLKAVVVGSTLYLYVNDVLVLTATDTALTSGAIGLRTWNSAMQVQNVNVTTPITPTNFVDWAITPIRGTLPFTISFSGYLSRYNNIPDTGTIVNGETIQIQALSPGSTTWVNTGITETTGSGPLGTGYFAGTWKLTEPGIYPGAWQFRAYYAGNTIKYLLGCGKPQKTRDLSRVNALIL